MSRSLSSCTTACSGPYDILLDWCPSEYKVLFDAPPATVPCTPAVLSSVLSKTRALASSGGNGVSSLDYARDSFSAVRLSKPADSEEKKQDGDQDSPPAGSIPAGSIHTPITAPVSAGDLLAEQSSLLRIPLPLIPACPTSTKLPPLSAVVMAMNDKRLLVLPANTDGSIAVEFDKIPVDDDDDDDEDYDEIAAFSTATNNTNPLYRHTISRLSRLIAAASPLLPTSARGKHATFCAHAAAAFGVGLTPTIATSVAGLLFDPNLYEFALAKRKCHTVTPHVGMRNWAKGYNGMGLAVESKQKVSVHLKSSPGSDSPGSDSSDDNKVGDCVITVVQGIPCLPAYLSSLNGSPTLDGDDSFEDPDASNQTTSLLVVADPDQGYVLVKFVPFFGEATLDETDDDFITDLPNYSLNSNTLDAATTNTTTTADDDAASVSSSASSMALNNRIPLSMLTQNLGIGYDPESDRPLPGLASAVYVFGDNDCNALGLSRGSGPDGRPPELVFTPQPVHLDFMSPSNAIASISCSALHTVICTTLGAVYTCGDGSDGQLGHGAMRSTVAFTLVQYFAGRVPPPIIQSVSAASHSSGSHTAAVCSLGVLYTWGKASACGHIGSSSLAAAAAAPLTGAFFGNTAGNNNADDDSHGVSSTALGPVLFPRVVSAFKKRPVLKVSCGGGFTLAIACNSSAPDSPPGVYSWGLWAQGRLGLGATPSKIDQTYLHANTRKKVPRFQARPRRISSLDGHNVRNIAAGDSHSLAITSRGEVFAWGLNDGGQCGVVPMHPNVSQHAERMQAEARVNGDIPPTPPSIWDDVLTPRKVVPFVQGRVFATAASAGTLHSAVVDANNQVWTWGGGGHGACLGHGECSDEALAPTGARVVRAQRMHLKMGGSVGGGAAAAAASVSKSSAVGVNTALPQWANPRVVKAVQGHKIEKVSCGEAHTAAISTSGSMLCWGGGVGVVQVKDGRGEDPVENSLAELIEPVCVPREPCTSWLAPLATKVISDVSCGGQHTMCLTIGEKIGVGLGRRLLKASALTKKIVEEESDGDSDMEEEESDDDMGSMAASSLFSTKTSLMAQGATADCVLLVAGRRLYCHLVVLSKRCPKLRDLIYEEFRPSEEGLTELILPELRFDVCKCLLEFLYTDDVQTPLDPNATLPYDLTKAAESYQLPRLVALCQLCTALAREAMKGADGEDGEEDDALNSHIAVPMGTLPMDLGGALGEPEFADVKFTTSHGRTIYAHRCVLSARSAYFAAMFRSGGANESEGRGGKKSVVDVQVPDSYVGLLRMLVFIYCGNLAESNVDALLEDLMAADRYQLWDMKKMCESMIAVTPENAAATLDVACVVGAERLKVEALSVLSRKLEQCAEPDDSKSLKELAVRCPEVMPDLLGMLVEKEKYKVEMSGGINASEKISVEVGLVAGRELGMSEEVRHEVRREFLRKKEREQQAADEITGGETGIIFPLGMLAGLAALFFLYLQIGKVIVLGPLVPVINIGFTVLFFVRVGMGLRGKTGSAKKKNKKRG
jgi:alpha-tubulin suppressor-like RCC1 family protein